MSDRELLELQEEMETLKAELAAVKRDCAIRPRGVLRRLLASPRVRIALAAAVVAIPLSGVRLDLFKKLISHTGTRRHDQNGCGYRQNLSRVSHNYPFSLSCISSF